MTKTITHLKWKWRILYEPPFRVEQAWDHYTSDAANALDNIRECIRMVDNNLYDIEDAIG